VDGDWKDLEMSCHVQQKALSGNLRERTERKNTSQYTMITLLDIIHRPVLYLKDAV
jgi:hypothetical protein